MPRVNTTQFALLAVLSLGPTSGYGIKKKMKQMTDYFWSEGDGTIYPALQQLLKKRFVTCAIKNKKTEKSQKIYTLTEPGQRALEHWLAEEPTIPKPRNELLLKVFFGWQIDPLVLVQHIQSFKIHLQANLKKYQTIQTQASKKDSKNKTLLRSLTLMSGIMYCQNRIEWCDEALKILRKEI